MVKRFAKRLDDIAMGLIRPINPYGCIIVGSLTASWGLWLLLPWDTFSRGQLYQKMYEFAPEWAWGTWAFVVGFLIIAAVFKGLYKWLYRSLAFAVWHWGTVALMMWWADWQNTAGLNYTFIDIICVYMYLNIKINYKKQGEDIPNFFSI